MTDDREALRALLYDTKVGLDSVVDAVLTSDWLRARDERNWDAGHNHCFHVDPPKSTGNPHRLPPFASKDLTTPIEGK